MNLANKHFATLLFFIFCVSSIYSQNKKYEIPTLDNGKVFNAKLTPDSEQKEVLSAYLKGKITKDTLRVKVNGTTMVQNVTITVLCLDKNEEINVEIAKGQWKKVERKGKTKKGYYRISFKTANDFGISLHNNKIGTPFNLIIWTSGELKPKNNNLFIPISEYNNKNNTSFKVSEEESNKEQKSNSMYYIIIAVLIIIAILLFMLLKKKKNKSLGLFLILFMLSNMTFSQISNADQNIIIDNLDEITGIEGASRVTKFFRDSEGGQSDYELLTEDDRNHEPNVNPDGQPELPSSCKSAGNKNRPTRNKVKPKNNRRNTNRASTNDEDTKYDDIDRPKYDDDGNAIDYGRNSTATQDNNPFTDDGRVVQGDGLKKDKDGNPIPGSTPDNQNNPFTDDGVVVQGDGLKKDEDGNPIPGPAPSGHNNQVMDDEVVVIHNIEHPKYDKKGNAILYDTSDRPRHDVDGVPINYATENDQTDYNRNGRPKYDKDGKSIIYDNIERPNYDKNGTIITYRDTNNAEEGTPEFIDNDAIDVTNKKNDASKPNSSNQNNVTYDEPTDNTNNKVQNGGSKNQNTDSNSANSEGCECLENAYAELETTRYQFEKLRIIYTNTESFTKKQISFGDDVSPLTGGIGGLAWQKQRTIILKSMEAFYKAYDNKYLQFVGELKINLKEIEKCEAQLDFENWYSRVGFLYFNFIKDKYKRN